MTERPQSGEGAGQAEFRKQIIHDIGLGELRQREIDLRFTSIQRQLQIGLQRDGAPTKTDGGLLAIRTGIPTVTPQAWDLVTPGSHAFVADIAGTNWKVMRATKEDDGSVSLQKTSNKAYHGKDRHVTFDEFVSRIAYPIAGEILASGSQDDAVDIGISLGFPHVNRKTPQGMEADLVEVGADGKLPAKEWKITDWDPDKHTNVTGAVRAKLESLGISVRTLVAINDTPAVALDGGAVQEAQDAGMDVIPAGFVGGTGTNGAINFDGLVNLEIGHATFPEAPEDEVFKKMKEHGWVDANQTAELEHEAGMYLPFRLAAGIEVLEEKGQSVAADPALMAELKSTDENKDQAIVSKLATGEIVSNPDVQQLAQTMLKREGQMYGIALAAMAEAAQTVHTGRPLVLLAEGGAILEGPQVRETAEKTAADKGQQFKIREATGLKGVASLAMAFSHIN